MCKRMKSNISDKRYTNYIFSIRRDKILKIDVNTNGTTLILG